MSYRHSRALAVIGAAALLAAPATLVAAVVAPGTADKPALAAMISDVYPSVRFEPVCPSSTAVKGFTDIHPKDAEGNTHDATLSEKATISITFPSGKKVKEQLKAGDWSIAIPEGETLTAGSQLVAMVDFGSEDNTGFGQFLTVEDTCPASPESPDTPESPETPDTPDTSEAPDTPNTPNAPNAPDTPELPTTPDTQEPMQPNTSAPTSPKTPGYQSGKDGAKPQAKTPKALPATGDATSVAAVVGTAGVGVLGFVQALIVRKRVRG